MTTVAELIGKRNKQRRGGCAQCGEPSVAAVMVTLRQLDEIGHMNGKATSRQRSLCDKHAVALYEKLLGEMP